MIRGGGGGTPYNGLYGEAPPERGTFFRLQVYKRVGISQVEVYRRVGKSVACKNSRPSSLPARVAFCEKDVCDLPPKIPY